MPANIAVVTGASSGIGQATSSRQLAVVTGASSGISAVYADRLAKRGHDLVLVARRAQRLQSLATEIAAAYGVRVEPLIADLESEAGQASVAHLLATNSDVSVLVNNLFPSTDISYVI